MINILPESVVIFLNRQDFQMAVSGFNSCGFNIALLIRLNQNLISVKWYLRISLWKDPILTDPGAQAANSEFLKHLWISSEKGACNGAWRGARHLTPKGSCQNLLWVAVFSCRHLNSVEVTCCTLMIPRGPERFNSCPTGQQHCLYGVEKTGV